MIPRGWLLVITHSSTGVKFLSTDGQCWHKVAEKILAQKPRDCVFPKRREIQQANIPGALVPGVAILLIFHHA
jgi:hypothetical protein